MEDKQSKVVCLYQLKQKTGLEKRVCGQTPAAFFRPVKKMFYKAKYIPNTSTHCRQDPVKKEKDDCFSTDISSPLPPVYLFLELKQQTEAMVKNWSVW